MLFYQMSYDRCINEGYEPLMDIVGKVQKDENIDRILDLFDFYCDIQELLILNNLK